MNKEVLLIYVIGSFLFFLYDIFLNQLTSISCAKIAKYNCDKCKNWRCYYCYCKRKRGEIENDRKNRQIYR